MKMTPRRFSAALALARRRKNMDVAQAFASMRMAQADKKDAESYLKGLLDE